MGIDLIPCKTCSFDCIYCQIGRTTIKTITRAEHVPIEAVLSELEQKIKGKPKIDFLTISGSGEPTLHSGLGKIIKSIKKTIKLPVAVITNGSLLWREDVQQDLLDADVVLPTLSSSTPEIFKKIHRPARGLSPEKSIKGMIEFRKKYRGRIWLELFIIRGINDRVQDVGGLKSVLANIKPDRVQINTSTRTPSEDYSFAAPRPDLERLKKLLGNRAEVIAEFRSDKASGDAKVSGQDILNYLKRRPGTLEDISLGMNVRASSARKILERLLKKDEVSYHEWQGRREYFIAKPK